MLTSRWVSASNIAVVLLLSLIAAGIYTMPRFNWATVVSRQERLAARQAALEARLETLNLLAGEEEDRRAAVLLTLDSLPELISDLRDEVGAILEFFGSRAASEGLHAQIDPRPADAPGTDLLAVTESLLDPRMLKDRVELPAELRVAAETFSTRGTAQIDFGEFLAQSVETGVLSYESVSQIPETTLRGLKLVFGLYKAAIRIVDQEERTYVEERVSLATERGDYVEVEAGAKAPAIARAGNRDLAAVHVKMLPDTFRKRVFTLPFDENAEFYYFADLRANARDQLIRAASGIAASE